MFKWLQGVRKGSIELAVERCEAFATSDEKARHIVYIIAVWTVGNMRHVGVRRTLFETKGLDIREGLAMFEIFQKLRKDHAAEAGALRDLFRLHGRTPPPAFLVAELQPHVNDLLGASAGCCSRPDLMQRMATVWQAIRAPIWDEERAPYIAGLLELIREEGGASEAPERRALMNAISIEGLQTLARPYLDQ